MPAVMRSTILIFLLLSLAGCSTIQEPFKVVWGSSTRALEKARDNAVRRSFFCAVDQCFDAVLLIAQKQSQQAPALPKAEEQTTLKPDKEQTLAAQKAFDIFLQDRKRRVIVILGVPESNPMTEVGIFLTAAGQDKTTLEITSLSTSAKVRAADMLFAQLAEMFQQVE